jgi:hypothetical protein
MMNSMRALPLTQKKLKSSLLIGKTKNQNQKKEKKAASACLEKPEKA